MLFRDEAKSPSSTIRLPLDQFILCLTRLISMTLE